MKSGQTIKEEVNDLPCKYLLQSKLALLKSGPSLFYFIAQIKYLPYI